MNIFKVTLTQQEAPYYEGAKMKVSFVNETYFFVAESPEQIRKYIKDNFSLYDSLLPTTIEKLNPPPILILDL